MNPNISIEMFMFLSVPLVEISQINFTMTLNFDLGNIELGRFLYVPQVHEVEICKIIKNEISP
jgi:hypothetical protein